MNTFENTEKIYTLADLRVWNRAAPSFAVLGKPIAHSLSPKMHNRALADLAGTQNCAETQTGSGRVPADAKYFRFEISPEELGEALPIFLEKNFRGLNLTLPHKVAALPFLREISPEAAKIGAANTLVALAGTQNSATRGGWRGENTDGRGFARAAQMQLGRALAGTHVILLGAGGAARAIAATALAQNCASLTIANRSRERREALADTLRAHFPELSGKIAAHEPFSTADSPQKIPPRALIANATSLGLAPADTAPFPPELLRADCAVYDTTYAAAHTSALVAAARERGVPAANGLAMLAWQGALAFEIWTGVPAQRAFPPMFAAIS